MNVNKLILIGRLGRTPELAYTQSKLPMLSLSVATSKNRKKGDEWESETAWHDVVVFGDQAERLAVRGLERGGLVYVEGELGYREYTDKNNSKQKRASIFANTVKYNSMSETKAPVEMKAPYGRVDSTPSFMTEEDVPF